MSTRGIAALHDLVASLFGPHGGYTAITASTTRPSALTLACSSSSLDNLRLDDDISNLLLQLLSGQLTTLGDGGLSMILFATRLILRGTESGVHPRYLIAGYQQSLQWALEYLGSASCPCRIEVDIGNQLPLLLDLVQHMLATKHGVQVAMTELRYLALLIVRAFLNALPESLAVGIPIPYPHLRIHVVAGEPVSSSQTLQAVILDGFELPPGAPKLKEGNVVVALFNTSLVPVEVPEIEPELVISQQDQDTQWDVDTTQLERLSELVRGIVRHGVGLVGCQKLIHPYVKHQLLRNGVIPLERLSIQHIAAVQAVSGAAIVSSLGATLSSTELGSLSKVEEQPIGGQRCVLLHPSPHAPRQRAQPVPPTLILCAENAYVAEDMRRTVSCAVRVLTYLLHTPALLAGGGCTELHVAAWVRAKAKELAVVPAVLLPDTVLIGTGWQRRSILRAIDLFAACLEDLAAAVDRTTPPDQLLEALRSANHNTLAPTGNSGVVVWGWDSRLQTPRAFSSKDDPTEGTYAVYDALHCKRLSWQAAVEAAGVVLRLFPNKGENGTAKG